MNDCFRLQNVLTGNVGTTAKDISLGYRAFLLRNTHATNSLHFREKTVDNTAVTSSNGFTLAAGECTPIVLRADKLSVLGSAASTTYQILLLD